MWIGVAIEIPDPYRASLQRARIDAGDPRAWFIAPHITLLPPTQIPDGQIGDVVAHIRRAAADHRPFVVRLAGTDTFRPVSPVVFVPLERGQEECARLYSSINSGVLTGVPRFPYKAHVTIAHEVFDAQLDAAARAMANFAAEFPVASFELYEHDPDGVWRGIDRFTLTV